MEQAPVAVPRRLAQTRADRPDVQISNATKSNRYPYVFRVVQTLAGALGLRDPKLLSYGCSTGQEVDTLATMYFPGSQVLGVDVSDTALAQARENFGHHPKVRFERSEAEFLRQQGPFDIIFAMSVLCRWPESKNLDDLSAMFPYDVFEHHVRLLDSLLAPGGIMVIYNASYAFLESDISRSYDLVTDRAIKTSGFVKRFRRDGKACPTEGLTDCIFVKGEASDGLTLRDSQFRPIGRLDRGPPRDPS